MAKLIKGQNDLATTNPELCKQWDYSKNGDLTPNMVSKGLKLKVWWICEKGHSYEADITRRVIGSGCPYCASVKVLKGFNDLETTYPQIAKEWNYKRNGSFTPDQFMPKSGKKVWWICSKGHEWEMPIYKRTSRGDSCPVCSGRKVVSGVNDLFTTNGSRYSSIFNESGITVDLAGENLGWGYSIPANVCSAWKVSPTHYENIINYDFNYIGIGVAPDPNPAKNLCWVLHFTN